MRKRPVSGFTLIELAIVIAIIGILAAVAVPRFQNLTQASQKSVADSTLQSLQTSAAIYVAQQRMPPTSFANFVVATGAANGAYTMSLQNVQKQLYLAQFVTSTRLRMYFKPTGSTYPQANYFLNGSDVTATFTNF